MPAVPINGDPLTSNTVVGVGATDIEPAPLTSPSYGLMPVV